MTRQELIKAVELAHSGNVDYTLEDLSPFGGFGLKGFVAVYVTLRQVAALIRYQCCCYDGSWDNEALQDVANLGRKRFLIVG